MAENQFKVPTSVNAYLKADGAELLSAPDADGFAKIKDPEGNEIEFNVKQFMADEMAAKGLKPEMSTVIPLSDSSNPIAESGLGFMQQMKVATARTAAEKYDALVSEFGKENVKRSATGFSVKDAEGNWKSGEADGFIANFLANDAAAAAGSVAGAYVGAGLTGPLAPVGAVGGATIGALIGKGLTLANAYAMGIRSEVDVAEIGKELAVEALTAGAFEGVGLGIKALKAGGSSASKLAAAAKRAAVLDEVSAPSAGAKLVSKLTGQDEVYSRTLFSNADEAADVIRGVDKWRSAGSNGFNPAVVEQMDLTNKAIEGVKKTITSEYAAFEAADAIHLHRVSTSISDTLNSLAKAADDNGIKLLDDSGKLLSRNDMLKNLSSVTGTKDIKPLREIVDTMHSVLSKSENVGKEAADSISMYDLNKVVRKVNGMLADSSRVGQEMAGPVERTLATFKTNLRSTISKGMANGPTPEVRAAGLKFDALNAKYAEVSSFLSDIARTSGDEARTSKLVGKLVNPNSSDKALYNSLVGAIESSQGKGASTNLMRRLRVLETGRRFADPQASVNVFQSAAGRGMAASANVIQMLKDSASISNGLRSMPPGSIKKDPMLVDKMFSTIQESKQIREATGQALMQGAVKAIGGGNQSGQQ